MPEFPDIELYLHALVPRIVGARLDRLRLAAPFFLRSTAPPPAAVEGRVVTGVSRLGKRVVLELGDVYAVIHLMIAGRLQWKPRAAPVPKRLGLAAFDFATGSLLVTEAGSTRRASLHLAAGKTALAALDPGGREPLAMDVHEFSSLIAAERHTLKRTLTDPTMIAGIGNAYSDEILLRAGLSPFRLSDSLTATEAHRLHSAIQATLVEWRDRLIAETAETFPAKVTAFRPGMQAHGRYGLPCPACGTAIQRIRYATNEANYCPTCQTGGRLLADRGLSRLLRADWPKTLEALELRKREQRVTDASDPARVDEPPPARLPTLTRRHQDASPISRPSRPARRR